MKNIELCNYGVQELNTLEKRELEGGVILVALCFLAGVALGGGLVLWLSNN